MTKLLLAIFFLTTTAVALDEEPEVIRINKFEILVFGSNKLQVIKEGKTLLNYDCARVGCLVGTTKNGWMYDSKRVSIENIKFHLNQNEQVMFEVRIDDWGCGLFDFLTIDVNSGAIIKEGMGNDHGPDCWPPDDDPGPPLLQHNIEAP